MTATPIPRTLILALYSDIDCSQLTEKPAGRLPVDTRSISLERLERVLTFLKHKLAQGAQVYWVCPLIEESEKMDLMAVKDRHTMLEELFGDKVGLLHGRMTRDEKDVIMSDFASHSIRLLVTTTVIEVGLDVPTATVMVIEHAERFGLAQLHQLRGRIGRDQYPSTCILLYAPPLSETARNRLQILRETEDGFKIAEKDLSLRGSGDILGTKQSGIPGFHIADLNVHGPLLKIARDDARLLLEKDPNLHTPRGKAITLLLHLYKHDEALNYIASG